MAALHFIDLGVQPDFTQPYLNFAHYGNQLKQNKSIVADAAKNSGATEEQRALMMAIAMQVFSAMCTSVLDSLEMAVDLPYDKLQGAAFS